MALTPQKRAEFAQKGYTEEELALLDAHTETFRQKLAAAGIQFKDLDDNQPQGQPAPQPDQGQPQQQPAPAPAQNPAPQQAPQVQPDQGQQQPAQQPQPVTAGDDQPVTLGAIRQIVTEAVDARMAATTNELETLKGQVASFKGGADEYFATLWQDKGRGARANTPSHSDSTVVNGGTPVVASVKEAEKEEWTDKIGVLNHPFFNAGAARIAAGKNGQ